VAAGAPGYERRSKRPSLLRAVMRHRIYRRAATSVWERISGSHVCEPLGGEPVAAYR
jgi:hypothetical protein